MKKRISLLLIFFLGSSTLLYADEGMWLLQLLKEQHSIDLMKSKGLQLEADELYDTQQISLKDAVGIFGGGCTGEIISPNGLILTNHHCGYSAIQQHSSVQHDYLKNGFWAFTQEEELPTPGLTFTFIERIEDVTTQVETDLASGKISEAQSQSSLYLDSLGSTILAKSDLAEKPGIKIECLPYYAGNKFYLVYKKVYSDIRMVAAPPSSIGKFGGETDNWMWPRHTGDFSIFRIYADEKGEPAEYSPKNKPVEVKRYLSISLKGFEEGDYAMIMGFPGRTERFLTTNEIQNTIDHINIPRIAIREARLHVLREAMKQNDSIRIMYATKYAQSSNYWKNAIGMNKAIQKNHILEKKADQEVRFIEFADSVHKKEYQDIIEKINKVTQQYGPYIYESILWNETFRFGIEFKTPWELLSAVNTALEDKNATEIDSLLREVRTGFYKIHNRDYSHFIDRKVAEQLIPLYRQLHKTGDLPSFYSTIDKKYKGNLEGYLADLYKNSIFSNKKTLKKFLKKPTQKAIKNDLGAQYAEAIWEKRSELMDSLQNLTADLTPLHKIYIRGLEEMNHATPQYPDANFTMRLTYGNVEKYQPRNAVTYDYYTTLEGVMEKDDPNDPEFIVPQKLKDCFLKKDYGRYALKDGRLPLCFISNNDITGGNSGSPVMNSRGELIGCAFDGNWESLSGNIQFDKDLQRCINVDIRYILFIIDKIGGCQRLIQEMNLVE
ncbi:MAG: S46 family peptidase [Bacteroidaceae bacterium]